MYSMTNLTPRRTAILTFIRERIADDAEGRDALAARFLYSQSFSQEDPWAERAAGADRVQHSHMAEFHPMGEIA